METLKFSIFNRLVADENQYYLFNTRTGSLAELNQDEKDRYISLLNSDDSSFGSSDLFIRSLIEAQFLISKDLNEIQLLETEAENLNCAENRVLGLTIAPTLNCNFCCTYCYEKKSDKRNTMTADVQEDLLTFIKNNLKGKSGLSVCWYGGEPTLTLSIIENLSEQIIKICEEAKISYFASMITNGFLLTAENIKTINKCQITALQVTLDGLKKDHDRRRIHKNGNGTFDTIVNNLIENYNLLPHVSLRVNTDRANRNSVFDLYCFFKELNMLDKIAVYPGKTSNIDDCCHKDSCLSSQDFSELALSYLKATNASVQKLLPARKQIRCTADSDQSYVIGPQGELYKCWDDIGKKEYTTGDIWTGWNENNRFIQFKNSMPFSDLECVNCDCLPICLGNCPRLFFEQKECSKYKYILDKAVILAAKRLTAKQ